MAIIKREINGITEISYDGDWTAKNLLENSTILYQLLEEQAGKLYLLLNFSDATHVDPNAMTMLITSPVLRSERVAMTVIAVEKQASRFLDQLLQVQRVRNPKNSTYVVRTRREALDKLSNKRLIDDMGVASLLG